MKFKENAIKPGMVIHCPKKEDARALFKHLKNLGYRWSSGWLLDIEYTYWNFFDNNTCYQLSANKTDEVIGYENVDVYQEKGLKITEFSDLVEPDDAEYDRKLADEIKNSTEMRAVEVLEWLEKNGDDTDVLQEVFGEGCINYDDIFGLYPAKEILSRITGYEVEKSKPKRKIKTGYMCAIMGSDNVLCEIVYLWDVSKEEAELITMKHANEIAEKDGGSYTIDVTYVCRSVEE